MSEPFFVVIPARFASTRLPGKPLADLHGRPMVVRVAERATAAGAARVVVATDDPAVLDAVEAAGFEALLTRDDHPSGSDRVMEVAERLGWSDHALVINVQGDEPQIPPAVIAQLADLLRSDPDVGTATLCEPITDAALLFDPNVVKVVTGSDGFALYFSRAPIPYARDAFAARTVEAQADQTLPEPAAWYRHIGVYAFRLGALRRFVALPVGRLEQLEALEQLRMLEHGMDIRMAIAAVAVPGGVDTAADLERVRRDLASER
jgi:3-deoxy-manno-octulosonate cytidylyltransferase (CMP-KDO synthetase)